MSKTDSFFMAHQTIGRRTTVKALLREGGSRVSEGSDYKLGLQLSAAVLRTNCPFHIALWPIQSLAHHTQ